MSLESPAIDYENYLDRLNYARQNVEIHDNVVSNLVRLAEKSNLYNRCIITLPYKIEKSGELLAGDIDCLLIHNNGKNKIFFEVKNNKNKINKAQTQYDKYLKTFSEDCIKVPGYVVCNGKSVYNLGNLEKVADSIEGFFSKIDVFA